MDFDTQHFDHWQSHPRTIRLSYQPCGAGGADGTGGLGVGGSSRLGGDAPEGVEYVDVAGPGGGRREGRVVGGGEEVEVAGPGGGERGRGGGGDGRGGGRGRGGGGRGFKMIGEGGDGDVVRGGGGDGGGGGGGGGAEKSHMREEAGGREMETSWICVETFKLV